MVTLIDRLTHLNGKHHHTEDIQIVAAADVAAKTYGNVLFDERTDWCQARGDVQVRRGAMSNHHPSALHQFQFLPGSPYAVGHHSRRLSEQSVAIIGVAIAGAFFLERLHPSYLGSILREM